MEVDWENPHLEVLVKQSPKTQVLVGQATIHMGFDGNIVCRIFQQAMFDYWKVIPMASHPIEAVRKLNQ